jgi:hypothetical protein
MSQPSGDEPVTTGVQASAGHETRRRAAAAGRAAEQAIDAVLDRLEGLSLWALEQAAESRPESDRVRSAESRLHRVRRMTAPLPRNANRLVAGSAYFALRWAPEALSSARDALRETSAFLNAEPEQPKPVAGGTDTKSPEE